LFGASVRQIVTCPKANAGASRSRYLENVDFTIIGPPMKKPAEAGYFSIKPVQHPVGSIQSLVIIPNLRNASCAAVDGFRLLLFPQGV